MAKEIPSWGKTIIYGVIAALVIRLAIANAPQVGQYF
jgi:hypothetical protein